MCLQLILEVNRLPVDFNAAYLRMGNTQGFDRILYARISGERVRYSLKTFFFGQKIIQASVKKEDCDRCQPWRAKRRLVVTSSREAALFSRRALAPEGKQSRPPNAASSHMGAKHGAATSLRSCCAVLGDQDCWGTNRLSKAESILGTGMSQNLSRGRRHT